MRNWPAYALLLLASASAGSAQPPGEAGGQSITVGLSSFSFTPATIMLRQGERYRMRFVNTSSGGHNFVARDFFASSTLSAEDVAKIRKGSIEVRSGDAVEITLTPNRAGTFKSHCSHFMHSAFGMTGRIVVQPSGG